MDIDKWAEIAGTNEATRKLIKEAYRLEEVDSAGLEKDEEVLEEEEELEIDDESMEEMSEPDEEMGEEMGEEMDEEMPLEEPDDEMLMGNEEGQEKNDLLYKQVINALAPIFGVEIEIDSDVSPEGDMEVMSDEVSDGMEGEEVDEEMLAEAFKRVEKKIRSQFRIKKR